MRLYDERITRNELDEFLKTEGFSDKEFANLLGVTIQAVRLWKTGDRTFTVTNTRLLRMFMKYPQLIREFGRIA